MFCDRSQDNTTWAPVATHKFTGTNPSQLSGIVGRHLEARKTAINSKKLSLRKQQGRPTILHDMRSKPICFLWSVAKKVHISRHPCHKGPSAKTEVTQSWEIFSKLFRITQNCRLEKIVPTRTILPHRSNKHTAANNNWEIEKQGIKNLSRLQKNPSFCWHLEITGGHVHLFRMRGVSVPQYPFHGHTGYHPPPSWCRAPDSWSCTSGWQSSLLASVL